jgi:hypothetical protein
VGIVDALGVQHVGSRDWKNLHTKTCDDMALESSSGAENATKIHSKTSPTYLEGSRVPNSDPKIRDFSAGNRPLKSPPASTKARPPSAEGGCLRGGAPSGRRRTP